jgi:hypothetical protein
MALKVIGAGFGRTGTLSLKVALEKLGFGPCHHMKEVILNGEQTDYFYRASIGETVDWDAVFNNYQSTVDWPSVTYYKELAEKYPNAKVILGIRDASAWYDSARSTIYQVPTNFPKWIRMIFPRSDRLMIMMHNSVFGPTFSNRFEDKEFAMDVFNKHIEAVKENIPEDRLLIHNAKDGWEPLCRFLDVPVPSESYPWVNDSIEFKRRILFIKSLKWLPVIILLSILVSLLSSNF